MNLQTALDLQKRISDKFLFSRQNVYANAGPWDDDHSASDLVYDIFQEVFGVAVSGTDENGYQVELLTEDSNLYLTPILRYFDQPANSIVANITSPFFSQGKQRPLIIGCSVSHRLNNIMGTLGCFVKGLNDGQTYILSNHHVLYNESDYHDNFIVQPCTSMGGNSGDAIGLYERSLLYSASDLNEFGAAIAGPISVEVDRQIPGTGKKINGASSPVNELKVFKIGAATGTTFGKVKSFLTNVKVNIDGHQYDFANQTLIQGFNEDFSAERPFSAHGDSGSLIIDNERFCGVGLLFAGNNKGMALANPIELVLSKLEVDF